MKASRSTHVSLRHLLLSLLIAVLALSGVFAVTASAAASPQPDSHRAKPTIVLVHGAFADASGWNGVADRLQRRGYTVVAPANPLRGIHADSAYIHSYLSQISGPILLVGHSYGGAVISNAAYGIKNVIGLVFVSGFAPDKGEVLGQVEAGSKDSVLNTALVPLNYPVGPGAHTAVEYIIKPSLFHSVFAADLSAKESALMAATQRPAAAAAFSEPSGPPAWKTLPSWAVIATGDKAAGSDVLLAMAKRAGAKITLLKGSHVIMISQPKAVADVILSAAQTNCRR